MAKEKKLPRKGLYFVADSKGRHLPEVLRTLADMLESGQLKHHAGRLTVYALSPKGDLGLSPGEVDRLGVVSSLVLTKIGG